MFAFFFFSFVIIYFGCLFFFFFLSLLLFFFPLLFFDIFGVQHVVFFLVVGRRCDFTRRAASAASDGYNGQVLGHTFQNKAENWAAYA